MEHVGVFQRTLVEKVERFWPRFYVYEAEGLSGRESH